jgi:hypothetical protein
VQNKEYTDTHSSRRSNNDKINSDHVRASSELRAPPIKSNINTNDSRSKSVLDIRDITPELAAQVVKNYLLPMFDGDRRKVSFFNLRL